MESLVIREIRPEDNPQVDAIIKSCFVELDLPLTNTAYADAETPFMYESFQNNREVYYVVSDEASGEVLGGGGIKPLKDYPGNICELQKMYFSTKLRGKGFGKKLMERCLAFAEQAAFEKVYIETFPTLKAAIQLYRKFGFKDIDAPLGNTGHCACDVWMEKQL